MCPSMARSSASGAVLRSGQMARNGYPNPADRLFYAQVDVWNTIQAHNSTSPADSGWATDPHGLTGCLQSLSNPPGVHWVEFSDASRDAVLFDILFWINQREYPSPVLVNQGGHWVVIVRYETDVEPVAGSSPTLQSIKYHDPEPHNVGTVTNQTGAQWFSGPGMARSSTLERGSESTWRWSNRRSRPDESVYDG